MKVIKLSISGKTKYINVKLPELKKDWALIKIIACGLCGSDVQKIKSDLKSRKALKTDILGHEFSGVIEDIMPDQGFMKGDRVSVIPLIFDKSRSITKSSSLGKDLPGGFSEYCLVPITNLRKIPDDLSFELASLADVVAVSLHAYNLCNDPLGKNILVLGDGAIALSTAILLLLKGNTVSVLGKNKYNLDVAKKLGIKTVTKLENDNIFECVFECVGRSQDDTLRQAISAIKPQGRIVVLGVYKKDFENRISLRNLFYKEGSLIGSNSYITDKSVDDFAQAIKLISENKDKFSELLTHKLSLSDFNKGLELVKKRDKSKVIKVIFNP